MTLDPRQLRRELDLIFLRDARANGGCAAIGQTAHFVIERCLVLSIYPGPEIGGTGRQRGIRGYASVDDDERNQYDGCSSQGGELCNQVRCPALTRYSILCLHVDNLSK